MESLKQIIEKFFVCPKCSLFLKRLGLTKLYYCPNCEFEIVYEKEAKE